MSRDKAFHDLAEQVVKLAEIVEQIERLENPDGGEPRGAQNVAAAIRSIALDYPTDDAMDGGTFDDE